MRDAVTGKRGLHSETAEDGWALIEALMAAVVLAIVVLGVYSALNSSTHAAGFDRQRSTASALAEQDLERLRGISASGFASDIPDRFQNADGTRYRIQSSATWVKDSTGAEETCSDTDTDQGSYLKIVATVTPIAGAAAGAAASPVTMTSLMAPNAEMTQGRGTLAVRVTSSTGAAVPNAQVRLSTGAQHMTNAAGCAVFGFIPVGSYGVQAPSNLVDKGGVAGGAVTANVTENSVKTVELRVDQAATLDVNVQTKVNGNLVADKSDGIVAANSEVPTGYRQFTLNPATDTTRLTSLFPFTTGYTVYSGTCLAADPARSNPAYYQSYPGVVTLAPGGSGSVTVREPAMNLNVIKNGKPMSSARVVITDPDCPGTSRVYTTLNNGALPTGNVGLPFGHYEICATDGSKWTRSARIVDVDNEDPNGTPVTTVDVSSPNANSTCPAS